MTHQFLAEASLALCSAIGCLVLVFVVFLFIMRMRRDYLFAKIDKAWATKEAYLRSVIAGTDRWCSEYPQVVLTLARIRDAINGASVEPDYEFRAKIHTTRSATPEGK